MINNNNSSLLPSFNYLMFSMFLQGMDVALFKEAYDTPKFDFLLSHAAYCRDVLKLKKGQKAVVSNGRVSHDLVSYCCMLR